MPKFNRRKTRTAVSSPVTTHLRPTTTTYEGAPGYERTAKSELFLLAVSNLVGEDTFYEKATDRDARYAALVRSVALADPAWTLAFLTWLRTKANLRSAPLVGAAEAVKARLEAGITGEITSRSIVDAVLQRADEPGELLGYWTSRYGRSVPKPVKRGIADAVVRLYNERSLLKYDTGTRGFRFADVIELVHPSPGVDKPWQGPLFQYALERRHNRDVFNVDALHTVRANGALRSAVTADPAVLLDPAALRRAGMTWEDALSLAGSTVDKGQLWSAMIPSMGYMALLRNLRNFDEAGVSDEVAATVAAKLADPDEVAASRQLPFRFYSAYRTAPSLRWGHALDRALALATQNVPAFAGRTLVLVDTSASMTSGAISKHSSVTPAQAAALFGVCLAARGNAVDLVGFADGTFRHRLGSAEGRYSGAGASVLREVNRFVKRTGEVGHGTEIARSLRATYANHDRVVVISDMQTFADYRGDVTSAVPGHVPIYGFNLGGYRAAAMPTGLGTRHEIGGLSDATFRLIPLLEAGHHADWPWVE
jgi:hypothetical protein